MDTPLFKKKYLEKFGLNEAPYTTNPDERFLYLTNSHKGAIGLIEHTLELREGACLIIGEPGTGKTTIMRRIASLLYSTPEFNVGVIETAGHFTSGFQLVKEVLESFKQECRGQDTKTRNDQFKNFLVQQYKDSKTCVLLIDEAQQMSAKLLEELRGYLNVETSQQKLLQIILFAMPGINRRLPYAPSFKSRLTVTHLEKMNRNDTEDMLRWRFVQAGGKIFPFEEGAIDLLYDLSKGNPRLICGLSQLALETAASRNELISKDIVSEVSKHKLLS